MTTITTLIPLPPDLVERDRVRRQALRVGAVDHPGLAPLRDVAFVGDGLALTWDLPVGAESMPGTLITPERAVALLAPVAAGLALLHDAGLAHGGVTSATLHVVDGQAVLAGWRPGGTPTGDVRDVLAILDSLLPSASVGADIAHLLITGADPDPSARPSMARVAAALDQAATRGAPPISPPAHRRARMTEAPPPRLADPPQPTPRQRPGRHAAGRASAGVHATRGTLTRGVRIPWRWGVAIGGAVVAAFLGLSAVGSAGSAQEICPAAAPAEVAPSGAVSR